MATLHVKPAKGLRIRYPDNPRRLLDADGAEVPANTYWLRRLACGDVEQVKKSAGKSGGGKSGNGKQGE